MNSLHDPSNQTVAVIGAGFYGSMTALHLAQYDIFGRVVLTDVLDGRAEGLALDINQSRAIEGF
jgi:malate dehydrogenase